MIRHRRLHFRATFPGVLSYTPALWLDASDASTLYDATSGGNLADADENVLRWLDKSGNLKHRTRTSTTGLVRKVAAVNGLDTLRFDGTTYFDGATVSIGPSLDIFAVFKTSSAASQQNLVDFNGNRFVLFYVTSSQRVYSLTGSVSGASIANESVISRCSVTTGGACTIEKNGTPSGSGTTNYLTRSTLRVGGNSNAGEKAIGDFCELIILNYAATTAQSLAITRYLGTKWGITVA